MQITAFEKRNSDRPSPIQNGRRVRYLPKKSRIYIFPKGESILENLNNRRQRPHTAYKKELVPEILQKLGLPADTKVAWSQKAGCACGCSPGFVIPSEWDYEVFVTAES